MADLFYLSDEQWAVIEPFMPRVQPGPERKDDRQIVKKRWNGTPDRRAIRTPSQAGYGAAELIRRSALAS